MKTRLLYLSLILGAMSLHAADYYVAPDGDDMGQGSESDPYKTIQHAVNQMLPGDTCYLRAGSYHEVVDLSGISGSNGAPLTIQNYPGETAVLDGRIPVSDSWTLHSGNIYKTTLSEDVWQLWVDEKPQTLARFPNVEAWSDLLWERAASRRAEAAAGSNGHMVDDPASGHTDTLAAAGVSFDDCVAVMNLRNWTTYARIVSNHVAGTDNFDYDPVPSYTSTRARYFLEGGIGDAELAMLDVPGEWAFDEVTKTLYLWTDDGQTPEDRSVMAKNQTYFFTADGSTKHITLDGLGFLGTTADFTSADFIQVRNCTFTYPSFSKRALGSIGGPVGGLDMGGVNSDYNLACEVYNCEFRYVEGPVIYYKKSDLMRIENNLFYMIDYGCLNEGFTLNGNNSDGTVYRFNTIDTAGASESCRLGIDNPSLYPSTVEWNYHIRCGLLQTDGASVQYSPSSVNNSLNQFNWFIDNDRYGFRFDGDPAGQEGTVYRNVSRQTGNKGFRLKGDYHLILNNTAVNVAGGFNIALEKGGNANTYSANNAADSITDWPIPGTAESNYNAQVEGVALRDLLRDPDNLDFRPRSDALLLVDQGVIFSGYSDNYQGNGPDIGAYEAGETNYFIPGRRIASATHPVPPLGTVTAKSNADLMWRPALDVTSYTVFFGTASNTLIEVTNQVNNIYNPSGLAEEQQYFWRVDAVGAQGTHTGEVWSFTVGRDVLSAGLTNLPVADAYVENVSPDANFGTTATIELRTPETGSITRHGYLKFDVNAPGPIVSARLRLNSSGSLSGGVSAYGVSDNGWTETGVTWNNAPAIDGVQLDNLGGIANGEWGELDVSSLIASNGTYTIGLIRGPKDSNRRVKSRESALPPELIVEYELPDPNNDPIFNSNSFDLSDAVENRAYTNSIAEQAFDPDEDDVLTFVKHVGPDWLNIETNGYVWGTPGLSDVGPNNFSVRVYDDSGAFDESTMMIDVLDALSGNTAPVFDGNPIIKSNATENAEYTGSLSGNASDADGDALTFARISGPSWLNVETDGTLTGTPSDLDLGPNSFIVSVSDGISPPRNHHARNHRD